MPTKTTGEELSDMFYALQITVKILEGLRQEYKNGGRTQEDYESRFNSQAWLLTDNLKKVKPLVEDMIKDGYDDFGKEAPVKEIVFVEDNGDTECADTEKDVLHEGGEAVDTETQVQDNEKSGQD